MTPDERAEKFSSRDFITLPEYRLRELIAAEIQAAVEEANTARREKYRGDEGYKSLKQDFEDEKIDLIDVFCWLEEDNEKAKAEAYEDAARIVREFAEVLFYPKQDLPKMQRDDNVRKRQREQIADAIEARAAEVCKRDGGNEKL